MTLPMAADVPHLLEGGLWSNPWLLRAALLTVLIETPLFYLCGYRRRAEWLWFAAVNVVSNVLLNETLMDVDVAYYTVCAALGEALVVATELALMAYVVRGDRARLLRTLLLTNAASLCAGLIWAACLGG